MNINERKHERASPAICGSIAHLQRL